MITTEELFEALGVSRATRAILERHGLARSDPGRRKFWRRSHVAEAMRREAGPAAPRPEPERIEPVRVLAAVLPPAE